MFSGCVSDEDFQRQNLRLNSLQMEVRDLKDQAKLREMEMERQVGQTRQTLPEMRLEMDRMRAELQRLNNMVEMTEQRGAVAGGEAMSLKDQLSFIASRLDRLEQTLKLPSMSPPVFSPADQPATGEVPATGETQPADEPVQVDGPPAGETPEAAGPAVESDEAEYKVAEALYKQEIYNASLDKFKNFVARFPQSGFASAAQFYVGESLYNLKRYEEAILEYQKVIKKYPQSTKVSSALLKQAFSFLNIGDKTSAKLLLQKIIREYPKSYSAGVAKKKLPQIK